jgi:hypothetical protein
LGGSLCGTAKLAAHDRDGSKAALTIGVGRSGMSGMPPKADMRQSRRQLYANTAIAASRVAS